MHQHGHHHHHDQPKTHMKKLYDKYKKDPKIDKYRTSNFRRQILPGNAVEKNFGPGRIGIDGNRAAAEHFDEEEDGGFSVIDEEGDGESFIVSPTTKTRTPENNNRNYNFMTTVRQVKTRKRYFPDVPVYSGSSSDLSTNSDLNYRMNTKNYNAYTVTFEEKISVQHKRKPVQVPEIEIVKPSVSAKNSFSLASPVASWNKVRNKVTNNNNNFLTVDNNQPPRVNNWSTLTKNLVDNGVITPFKSQSKFKKVAKKQKLGKSAEKWLARRKDQSRALPFVDIEVHDFNAPMRPQGPDNQYRKSSVIRSSAGIR